MRIRSIKPEFWMDEEIGQWPAEIALFYIALWNEADDEGRFRANEQYLSRTLFPYRKRFNSALALQLLLKNGKVAAYKVEGQSYGLLINFKKHQKINRPTKSKLPPPPPETLKLLKEYDKVIREDSVSTHGDITKDPRKFIESSMIDHGGLTLGGGSREQGTGNREEGEGTDPLLTECFQILTSGGVQLKALRYEDLLRAARAHPMINDLRGQCRMASAHAENKTEPIREPGVFLLRWFRNAEFDDCKKKNAAAGSVDISSAEHNRFRPEEAT